MPTVAPLSTVTLPVTSAPASRHRPPLGTTMLPTIRPLLAPVGSLHVMVPADADGAETSTASEQTKPASNSVRFMFLPLSPPDRPQSGDTHSMLPARKRVSTRGVRLAPWTCW